MAKAVGNEVATEYKRQAEKGPRSFVNKDARPRTKAADGKLGTVAPLPKP